MKRIEILVKYKILKASIMKCYYTFYTMHYKKNVYVLRKFDVEIDILN